MPDMRTSAILLEAVSAWQLVAACRGAQSKIRALWRCGSYSLSVGHCDSALLRFDGNLQYALRVPCTTVPLARRPRSVVCPSPIVARGWCPAHTYVPMHERRRSVTWTCIVWGLCCWPLASQQTYCDASCQLAQQQALVSLYAATGGPAWQVNSELVHPPAGWLNTTTSGRGLPGHCAWSGEQCFVVLYVASQQYHIQYISSKSQHHAIQGSSVVCLLAYLQGCHS